MRLGPRERRILPPLGLTASWRGIRSPLVVESGQHSRRLDEHAHFQPLMITTLDFREFYKTGATSTLRRAGVGRRKSSDTAVQLFPVPPTPSICKNRWRDMRLIQTRGDVGVSLHEHIEWQGNELDFVTTTSYGHDRKQRIRSALGITDDRLPSVDDETLARYYAYLAEHMSFPFKAMYPEPTGRKEVKFCACKVLELLDPAEYAYDEFDGLFCKTEKAGFKVNLPLIELQVPQDSPNSQMIEDYWYWFWNWR